MRTFVCVSLDADCIDAIFFFNLYDCFLQIEPQSVIFVKTKQEQLKQNIFKR